MYSLLILEKVVILWMTTENFVQVAIPKFDNHYDHWKCHGKPFEIQRDL